MVEMVEKRLDTEMLFEDFSKVVNVDSALWIYLDRVEELLGII